MRSRRDGVCRALWQTATRGPAWLKHLTEAANEATEVYEITCGKKRRKRKKKGTGEAEEKKDILHKSQKKRFLQEGENGQHS